MSAAAYDLIADLYDDDMGRNMRFDDVRCYVELARASAGPVLELGCGTGRVLLALIAAGIDAIGVDHSLPMLRRLLQRGRELGVKPAVAHMDAARPALHARFALVLAPYSLVTYFSGAGELDDALRRWRGLLLPQGSLVLDAFVPQALRAPGRRAQDYRRELPDRTLTRSKCITPMADGRHRVERFYQVIERCSDTPRDLRTVEVIRPWTPDQLRAALHRQGLAARREWWDYAEASSAGPPGTAQFFTVQAAAPD